MALVNAITLACTHLQPKRALAILRRTEEDYQSGERWYQEPRRAELVARQQRQPPGRAEAAKRRRRTQSLERLSEDPCHEPCHTSPRSASRSSRAWCSPTPRWRRARGCCGVRRSAASWWRSNTAAICGPCRAAAGRRAGSPRRRAPKSIRGSRPTARGSPSPRRSAATPTSTWCRSPAANPRASPSTRAWTRRAAGAPMAAACSTRRRARSCPTPDCRRSSGCGRWPSRRPARSARCRNCCRCRARSPGPIHRTGVASPTKRSALGSRPTGPRTRAACGGTIAAGARARSG